MNASDAVKKLVLAGWTQVQIAQELGCKQPNVQKIKAGRGTTAERERKLRALVISAVRTKIYRERIREQSTR